MTTPGDPNRWRTSVSVNRSESYRYLVESLYLIYLWLKKKKSSLSDIKIYLLHPSMSIHLLPNTQSLILIWTMFCVKTVRRPVIPVLNTMLTYKRLYPQDQRILRYLNNLLRCFGTQTQIYDSVITMVIDLHVSNKIFFIK